MHAVHAALLLSAALAAPAAAQAVPTATPAAPHAAAVPAGVNWFTDLRAGLAEAKRTGRPVMLLAATPSCGGIPGTW